MVKEVLITRDPKILLGKPIIKGTRITVETILRKLSNGYTISQIIEAYPHINETQILACLSYASDLVANEEISDFA
jgi:uncharacterized protein (DUF433 family)